MTTRTTDAISSVGYTGPVGRELVEGPPVLLSVDQVRSYLRIPFSDEDEDVSRHFAAATALVEQHLGRSLGPASWKWWYDAAPSGDAITFPEPVRSVVLKTYDDDDAATTVTASTYRLDSNRGRLVFKDTATDWPPSDVRDTNGVLAEVEIGYASVSDIPTPIVEAVLLKTAALYQRMSAPDLKATETAIAALLAPYRWRAGVA